VAFFITLFYRCCFVWRTGLSEGTTDSQCHQFTFEQLSDRWCQLHTKTLRTVFKDFNFSLQLPTLNTRDYSLKCIITKFNSANLDGSGPKVLKIEHLTSLLQKKKKKMFWEYSYVSHCFTHTYFRSVSHPHYASITQSHDNFSAVRLTTHFRVIIVAKTAVWNLL